MMANDMRSSCIEWRRHKQAYLMIEITFSAYIFQTLCLSAFAQLTPEEDYFHTRPEAHEAQHSEAKSAEAGKTHSSWTPLVQCNIVHIPAAPNGGKLVDIPNEKLDVEAASKTISELEQKLFNRDFKNKSIGDRVDNLEQCLFGMGRLGTYHSRICSISSTLFGDPASESSNKELNSDEQDVSQLENRYYENEDFNLQPLDERVMRLESLSFGKSKTGDTHTRLLSLKEFLKKSDSVAAEEASKNSSPATEIATDDNHKHEPATVTIYAGKKVRQRLFRQASVDNEQALKFHPSSLPADNDLAKTVLMFKDNQSIRP